LANTVSEAETMVAAAERASVDGIRSMVGFNYRRVPALALAHNLVAEGALGQIRHVRSAYLQDWLVDPEFPLTWRLQRERAGSGALGDLGAHLIDLAQFLTGQQIRGVVAMSETFVSERPLPDSGTGSGLSRRGGQGTGRVTVDDATAFLARLSGGGMATFEASRMAPGRKNAMRIEVNGERGSLAFDFESMNELWLSTEGDDVPGPGAFRRILATEADHPYLYGWWPPGHGLGYDHTFTNEVRDLLEAVHMGQDPLPSFADGLVVQGVLDAVAASAQAGSKWIDIPDR
jgi:predicted dehydrogenase